MAVAGKNLVLKIGNSTNVLTDMAQYANDFSFPEEENEVETTTFTKNSRTRIVTLKDGSLSFSGPWDPALDTFMSGIRGLNDRTFEVGKAGSGAGMPKYTGNCVRTKFETSQSEEGIVEFDAEFQLSGDVTVGVYP